MRPILLAALLAAIATPALSRPEPPSTPAKETIQAALSAVLQADGRQARELLAGIPAETLDPDLARFRACAVGRLEGPIAQDAPVSPRTGKPDDFARQVMTLYEAYWRQGVMDPDHRDAAQTQLRLGLARLLEAPATLGLDAALGQTKARLERSGFHLVNGRTGYLLDLILWSKTETKDETVTLPEKVVKTRVFYLSDFQSQGWANYLTCDRTGTGGWATGKGLYIIVPAYKNLTDESFTISFLAHESQHHADYARFRKLAGWELEYRAKLVELAYVNATREQLLAAFASNQGNDPNDAHSYANRLVLATLRDRLKLAPDADLAAVPVDRLQQTAIAALREDTARRLGPQAR